MPAISGGVWVLVASAVTNSQIGWGSAFAGNSGNLTAVNGIGGSHSCQVASLVVVLGVVQVVTGFVAISRPHFII